MKEGKRTWRAAERPIVEDLQRAGIEVQSVWDLVNRSRNYDDAIPLLLDHLTRGGYPDRVMEGIARSLAVKSAGFAWNTLYDRYLKADKPDELDGLAVALAASASGEHRDKLVALLHACDRGPSRILLLSAILRIGGERGRQVIRSLRNDPELGAEARRLIRDC